MKDLVAKQRLDLHAGAYKPDGGLCHKLETNPRHDLFSS